MPSREKSPAFDPATDDAGNAIIDVADGIERIMGNRDLYARMLARFRADYHDGAAPIRAALDAGDRHLAHRRAHTLKGSAGMIGAHRLHEVACALELAIRTDPAAEQASLEALDPEFDQVLAALDGLLVAAPAPRKPSAPFKQLAPFKLNEPFKPLLADPALLAQLVELLLAGDGAAVDILEESGASLKVILGDARLKQVAAAVNDFDYEAALQALRQTSEQD